MLELLFNLRWYYFPLLGILSLLVIFIYTFIYKVIWEPWMRRRHFQKQGINVIKVSGLDHFGDLQRTLDKHGDALFAIRKEIIKNPNIKVFAYQIGPQVALAPMDASYIKEFLAVDYQNYSKAKIMELVSLILGKSLLYQRGEDWKVLRKLTAKAFQFDVLAANLGKIEETADWLYDRAQNGNLEKFNALDEFQMGTGEVVGKTFFGDNLNKYSIEGKSICLALSDLVTELSENTMTLLYFLFGMKLVRLNLLPTHRSLLRNIKNFKTMCQKIIAAQRASGKRTQGFLQIFFDAASDPEFSRFVTDDVIIDQFILMFIGGTDTTSHTLSLAMYFLERNPEMKARMEKELNEVWPEGVPVDITILNKLEYMHAFLKEVLRIGPPLTSMLPRQAEKRHKLLGIDIPEGTYVSLHFFAAHVNPKYYKNPEKFDPDRFLRKDPEEGFHKEPFAFMGFSAGPRNCIGQHLAMLKAKIFLGKMLRRFEFKLPADYKLEMSQNEFYEPRHPLVFHLSPKIK